MANNIVNLENDQWVGPWRIDGKLGEGGFGAVYKVSKQNDKASYAMKAEDINEAVKVLKMEVHVLQLVKEKKANHFCSVVDVGVTTTFCFLVMTLVGKSLQDLRKIQTGRKFSLGCALSIGRQCLEALEELHTIGYLHRDVKPSNYAIGHGNSIEELRKIYLIDFGMVAKCKERCRFEVGLLELMGGCPRQYIEILRYVDSLRYYDVPDYKKIYNLLKTAMTDMELKEFPYDWEPKQATSAEDQVKKSVKVGLLGILLSKDDKEAKTGKQFSKEELKEGSNKKTKK